MGEGGIKENEMGYNTQFCGELKFTPELTASQLAKIKSFLGEDRRDHPEWILISDQEEEHFYFVDLELLDDFSGLRWSGEEKSYGMTSAINLIIKNMQLEYPDFGLTGKLLAQGEDIDDRYEIAVKDNKAIRVEIKSSESKITCPHCENQFYLKQE